MITLFPFLQIRKLRPAEPADSYKVTRDAPGLSLSWLSAGTLLHLIQAHCFEPPLGLKQSKKP